jgi:hypothetical protein
MFVGLHLLFGFLLASLLWKTKSTGVTFHSQSQDCGVVCVFFFKLYMWAACIV